MIYVVAYVHREIVGATNSSIGGNYVTIGSASRRKAVEPEEGLRTNIGEVSYIQSFLFE
jgi:hypothetical protein